MIEGFLNPGLAIGATLAAAPDFDGITEVIQGERTYEEYHSASTPSSYGE